MRILATVVALAFMASAGWYVWLLAMPAKTQDACQFGSVGNDRYRATLATAEAIAESDRAAVSNRFRMFDETGVAALLRSQFERVAAGANSTAERIAAVHAVMQANGAEYRRTYPDVSDPFASATDDGLGAIQFWYRININRMGVFEPVKPYSLVRADFMLVDVPAEFPGDDARQRNDLDFVAILMSRQDSGLPQPPSDFDADCPPMPSSAWEAEFLSGGDSLRATPVAIETRIFLEDKPAIPLLAGHSYLVRRDVVRDASDAIVNAYNPVARGDGRRADQVIRANPDNVTGALRVFTGRLVDSQEHMATAEPGTRRSTDITATILAAGLYRSADDAWAAMSHFARDASDVYEYETAGFVSTANSNAVVQSALNAVGVDARTLTNVAESRYLLGFPGIETLIGPMGAATTVPAVVAPHPGFYVAGIQVRGRDDVDDLLIGTPFPDDFRGEQGVPDSASRDLVSYAASPIGVWISATAGRSLFGGFIVRGEGRGGHAEGDRYFGVEGFIGSPFSDVFLLGGHLANHVEGGSGDDDISAGEGDDTLIGGPGDDVYRIGPGSGADVVIEGGTDATSAGDALLFDPAISVADVIFARHGSTLRLSLPGGASVEVVSQFEPGAGPRVERFVFADGTVLSATDMAL